MQVHGWNTNSMKTRQKLDNVMGWSHIKAGGVGDLCLEILNV